jgi:hypothetical protein
MNLQPVQAVALEQVRLQLAAYKQTKLPLRFVNSHFHFHANRDFSQQAIAAVREHFPNFKGWIRFGDSKPYPGSIFSATDGVGDLLEKQTFVMKWDGPCNDTLWGMSSTFKNDAATVARTARQLGEGFHEFFFHPGRAGSLAATGRDHAALIELAKTFPKSERNLSALP